MTFSHTTCELSPIFTLTNVKCHNNDGLSSCVQINMTLLIMMVSVHFWL